jgi:hypothetical protein
MFRVGNKSTGLAVIAIAVGDSSQIRQELLKACQLVICGEKSCFWAGNYCCCFGIQ